MPSNKGMKDSQHSRPAKRSLKTKPESGHHSSAQEIGLSAEDKKAYSAHIKAQYRRSPMYKVFLVIKITLVVAIVLMLMKIIFF